MSDTTGCEVDTERVSYSDTGRLLDGSTQIPLSEAVVRASFLDAQSLAEIRRKAEAEARLDAYEDDYAWAIRKRIEKAYAPPNAAELEKVLDTTNNPLKRIVNEVSTLYAKPPVWSFKDPKAGPVWRSILRRGRAGVVFPRLNRMVNLLNAAFIYVRPCGSALAFRVVLPQDVSVVADPDNPAMPFAATLREIDPATPGATPVYHRWDRRPTSEFFGYRKFDAKFREVKGSALPNPYADAAGPVLPLVAYHREWPTWSFWDSTSGDDLYELTMMVGMWETWINHLFRTDSARQKYATGQIDASAPQQGGPDTILSLRSPDGEAVTVGEFSSQSDWNGLGAQVKRKFENVLSSRGLVLPDSRTSGDPTSGFALMVRSQGLIQARASQEPSFEVSDLELYRVVSAVWNFELNNPLHQLKGAPLPSPDAAEPDVKYAAYHVGKTAEERAKDLEIAEKLIALGLASPLSVYMTENPGVSEEEARAAIAKHKADAAAEDAGQEVNPATALNGAQVSPLLEVVRAVATKQMPRETGVEIILAAFPVDRATAERLMGGVGSSFFAEVAPDPAFGQTPTAPREGKPGVDEGPPAEE